MNLSLANMRERVNILLVQTAFIGDCILATPLVDAIKSIYPQAALTVLTTPVAKEFYAYHPNVKEVIVFDKRQKDSGLGGLLAMSKVVRDKRFDLVFSLHKSWRTAFLLWWAGIPQRFGFREAAGSFLYTKTVWRCGYHHEVLRNVAILENVGRSVDEFANKMVVYIPEAEQQLAEKMLSSAEHNRVIAIAPGSVWATKRWTVAGFSAVVKELVRQNWSVVLIGGAADCAQAEEIARRADSDRVINAVGKVSLLTSAAIIGRCRCLVTNDSAPLHLASACGTPVVSLFCATVPEMGYGPWQVEHENVEVENLSCRPCGRHGHKTCPTGTHYCQLNITVAMVMAKIENLMNRVGQDAHK